MSIVMRYAGTIQHYSDTNDPQDYVPDDDVTGDDLRDEPIINCDDCQHTAKELDGGICDKCPSNKERKK